MSFLTYLKSIKSGFERDKFIEACELTSTSITKHVIPAYISAEEQVKYSSIKSEKNQEYIDVYSRMVFPQNKKNIFADIRKKLQACVEIIDRIANDSTDVFSNTEDSIALSYKKVNYLRLADTVNFIAGFSVRFLNLVYANETEQYAADQKVEATTTPAERKYVLDNFLTFCEALKAVDEDTKKLFLAITDIPDATVTQMTELTFPTTIGRKKVDPRMLSHLSAKVNPFYFIGMLIASYQVDKYKAAKAQAELLGVRLLNLQGQMRKEPNAKLEKEVAYMANRVSELDYSIAQMEESYGLK
jgi:hypothetical protein